MSLHLDPRARLLGDALHGPRRSVPVPAPLRAKLAALEPGAAVDDEALQSLLDAAGALLSSSAGDPWPPTTKGPPVFAGARVVGEGALAEALRAAAPEGDALTLYAAPAGPAAEARAEVARLAEDGPVLVAAAWGELVELGPLVLDPALASSLERPEPELGASAELDPAALAPHLDAILRDPLFTAAWQRTLVRGERWWSEALPSPAPSITRAESPLLDLRRYLNPAFTPRWPEIGAALRAGELVHLPSALDPGVAERIWARLDEAERAFVPYEGRDAPGQFHYQHHRLVDEALEPPELRTLRLVFGSAPTAAFIESLTGDRCDAPVTVSASWFQPGEHQLPHSDNIDDRRVAFVWHLTRHWQGDYGGDLHWCPTGTSLSPAFNHLSLFHTAGGNKHMVTPVAPFARGKRLAVNGWWRSSEGLRPNPPPPPGRVLDRKLGIRAFPPFAGAAMPGGAGGSE